MSGSRTFHLNLAGQEWSIEVTSDSLAHVHRPLLALMNARARERGGRFIVFVGGPPGSGKTTLCALWESLAEEDRLLLPIQTLPLDGFHFTNEYLARTTIPEAGQEVYLSSRKGCPESYDLAGVRDRLDAVRKGDLVSWPFYDRKLHDPVENAITVASRGILLFEGNYLLLSETGWRGLAEYADLTIFIESSMETLQDAFRRLLKGGKPYQDALKHHLAVDHANYRRIMEHRLASDITLSVSADRTVSIRGKRRDAHGTRRNGKCRGGCTVHYEQEVRDQLHQGQCRGTTTSGSR
jgi:pantothenate kinase